MFDYCLCSDGGIVVCSYDPVSKAKQKPIQEAWQNLVHGFSGFGASGKQSRSMGADFYNGDT